MKFFSALALLFSIGLDSALASNVSAEVLLKQAYTNNPSLKSQQQSLEAALSNVGYERSSFFPELYVFADRSKSRKEGYLNSDVTTDSSGFKIQWNLFNGFADWNTYQSAKFSAGAVEIELQKTKVQTRSDLHRALVDYLVSQKALETWNKLLKLQKDQLLVVQLKYRNGLDALWTVEVTKANLEVTEATLNAERAKNILAKEKLESLIGAKVQENSLQSELLELLLKNPLQISEENTVSIEQKVLERKLEASKLTAAAARSGFLPVVNLSYQNGESRPDNTGKTTEQSIGVTFTWSLFSGFGTYFLNAKAGAEARALEYKLESLKSSVESNLKQYQLGWDVKRSQLKAKEAELKASRLWSDTIEKQYRLGTRDFSAWDQAQSKQISLEREYLTALANACYSKIEIEQFLGMTEAL